MGNDKKLHSAIIHGIDLPILLEQKIGLLEILTNEDLERVVKENTIDGVVNLLDSITDNIQDVVENKKLPTEIGIISSIISLSLFDDVRRFANNGIIAAHEKIQEFAIEFEQDYRDVKDWSQFCQVNNVSDWEEFILEEVKRKIA